MAVPMLARVGSRAKLADSATRGIDRRKVCASTGR
jgi:hypothetical protein